MGLALLTYVVQDRPLRALLYLAVGLTAVGVTAVLRARRPARPPASRAQRLRRGIVVVIGLVESVALAVGAVEPEDIWLLLLGVEVAAALVALTALPAIVRAVRAHRNAGASYDVALLAAAEELLPPALLTVARTELKLFKAAWRLVTPAPGGERDAARLSYGSSERLLLWVLLPCSLIELTVMDYLLRNTPLRVPLLILGLLSLPYVLGLVGLSKAYPHLLYADRLHVRSGPDFTLDVPLALVRRASRRTSIEQGNGIRWEEPGSLRIVRAGQTDLRLELSVPLASDRGPVTCLDVALDDPRHPALAGLLTRP